MKAVRLHEYHQQPVVEEDGVAHAHVAGERLVLEAEALGFVRPL